jgi:hypothetical protein
MHDHTISPLVPTELLISVLTEQLSEDVAIERGRLAPQAGSEKERRAILFPSAPASTGQRPPARLAVAPLQWFEP